LEGLGDKTGMSNNSAQVCKYFREVRDCALTTLTQCKKTRPAKIIHALFDEVNQEVGGQCLASGVDGAANQSSSLNFSRSLHAQLAIMSLSVLLIFSKYF